MNYQIKIDLVKLLDWQDEIEECYISTNGITLHTVIIGKGKLKINTKYGTFSNEKIKSK